MRADRSDASAAGRSCESLRRPQEGQTLLDFQVCHVIKSENECPLPGCQHKSGTDQQEPHPKARSLAEEGTAQIREKAKI